MLRSLLIVAAAILSVSANSAHALSPHPGFRQLNGCRALLHFKNINRTNYRTVILNCTSSVSYGQNLILLQEKPVFDTCPHPMEFVSEAVIPTEIAVAEGYLPVDFKVTVIVNPACP